jgi:hypothetical protein
MIYHEPTFEALLKLAPVFISYVISFLYVGIYWNNHHHLFQSVNRVNGRVLGRPRGTAHGHGCLPVRKPWQLPRPLECGRPGRF